MPAAAKSTFLSGDHLKAFKSTLLPALFLIVLGLCGFWIGHSFLKTPQSPQPGEHITFSDNVSSAEILGTYEVVGPSIGPLTVYETIGKLAFKDGKTASLKMDEADIERLESVSDIYLFDASGDTLLPFTARAEKTISALTGTRLVFALNEDVHDPDILHHKLTAKIIHTEMNNVRRLPRSTVNYTQDGTPIIWTVWQADDGSLSVTQTQADILIETDDFIGVSSSTARTDHVILKNPPKILQDGQKIENVILSNFDAPLVTTAQALTYAKDEVIYAALRSEELKRHQEQGTDKCYLTVNRDGLPYTRLPGGGPSEAAIQAEKSIDPNDLSSSATTACDVGGGCANNGSGGCAGGCSR